MIRGFCKIFTIGDRNTNNLFDGPVEITEKIDGSQWNFGVVNGHLHMRSKNVPVHENDGNKMFSKAVEFSKSVFEKGLLQEGWVMHGEYLQAPRHNALEYGRVPEGNFMLYGISGPDGSMISSHDSLSFVAKEIGCEVVPLIYQGEVSSVPEGSDGRLDWFKKLINRESVLGKAKIEGIVVKNYAHQPLIGGQVFPLLCGKFVSEAFKEVHKVSWKATNPTNLEQIGNMLNTEARWHKAVQRLREQNLLTDSPKDIGPILKEINLDIEGEQTENIKDELWRLFRKDVLRLAVKGFPEWYKTEILKAAL